MQLLPRFTLSPAIVLLVLGVLAPSLHAANWPSWRGPHGDGTSPERNVPLTWSATENVRWKIELPEPGDSSPVVWEDKVFITQAREATGGRTVMCFNRRDGKLLWSRGDLGRAEFRNNPPVIDGAGRIYVALEDKLWALAPDGATIWSVGGGSAFVSSPILAAGRLYVGTVDGVVTAIGDCPI